MTRPGGELFRPNRAHGQALSDQGAYDGAYSLRSVLPFMNQISSRPHLFGLLAGLFLASGIAFASVVLARTWIHLRETQIVDVTGSSRKNLRSDLVVWTGRLAVEAPTLAEAYAKFQRDTEKVRQFLEAQGQKSYTLSPVQVKDLRKTRKASADDGSIPERIGYQLAQTVQVSSADVVAVPKLAADCLSLLAQDVVLETTDIQFIYTKAGETKLQMMAEATDDARKRAEEIAARGGRTVRGLRSAKMGVVQINPLYSTATNWEGNNDTSTLDKTITVTVTAEFALQ